MLQSPRSRRRAARYGTQTRERPAGASDCAACVGVAMEAARAVVADAAAALPGPLVFLFNGGEETVLQASHGALPIGLGPHPMQATHGAPHGALGPGARRRRASGRWVHARVSSRHTGGTWAPGCLAGRRLERIHRRIHS